MVAPHAMATFATSFPFCAAQNNGVSPLPRGSESQNPAPDGKAFIASIEPIKQACKTGTLFDLDDFNGLAPRLNNISTHFGLFAVAAPASGVTPKEESNSTSAPATFTSASTVFASSLAMAYKIAVRPSCVSLSTSAPLETNAENADVLPLKAQCVNTVCFDATVSRLTSAEHFLINVSTTVTWPYSAAVINGVVASRALSLFELAPYFKHMASTASSLPTLHASCRAEKPRLVSKSTMDASKSHKASKQRIRDGFFAASTRGV
mmetsp:Transcript_8342/g.26671  ORF Transcript_8342/g.26671 Transcript_8342/m.26671 type:complete len:264 (-) Transcript_8342:9033-9824(-)